MLPNDRVDLVTCTACYGMFDRLLTDGKCPYCRIAQLESELKDEQLRSDVYDQNFQKAYKENKRLREALLDVINQACQVEITAKQECIISDLALSAYEDAIDLLEELGLVERLPGKLLRWKIKWEALGGKP